MEQQIDMGHPDTLLDQFNENTASPEVAHMLIGPAILYQLNC